MPFLPPRRWLQFRLSTWFVLVGILAWALMYWPWITIDIRENPAYWDRLDPPTAQPDRTGLLFPALALAAFVGWKGSWMLRERLRSPPQQH